MAVATPLIYRHYPPFGALSVRRNVGVAIQTAGNPGVKLDTIVGANHYLDVGEADPISGSGLIGPQFQLVEQEFSFTASMRITASADADTASYAGIGLGFYTEGLPLGGDPQDAIYVQLRARMGSPRWELAVEAGDSAGPVVQTNAGAPIPSINQTYLMKIEKRVDLVDPTAFRVSGFVDGFKIADFPSLDIRSFLQHSVGCFVTTGANVLDQTVAQFFNLTVQGFAFQ